MYFIKFIFSKKYISLFFSIFGNVQLIVADANAHVRVLLQGDHVYTVRDVLQKVTFENFIWKDNTVHVLPFTRLQLENTVSKNKYLQL